MRKAMFSTNIQPLSCCVLLRFILFSSLAHLYNSNLYANGQPVSGSDPCYPNPCVLPIATCHSTNTDNLKSYTCVCADGSNCENSRHAIFGLAAEVPEPYIMLLRKPPQGPGNPGGKGPGTNKPKGTKKPPGKPRITTPAPPLVTQPREDAGRQTEPRPTKSDPKNTTNSENPADQQPSSEEEWEWYGLTRNDFIAIGVPTVIAVPSALLAIAKIWLVVRNRNRNPDLSSE